MKKLFLLAGFASVISVSVYAQKSSSNDKGSAPVIGTEFLAAVVEF